MNFLSELKRPRFFSLCAARRWQTLPKLELVLVEIRDKAANEHVLLLKNAAMVHALMICFTL